MMYGWVEDFADKHTKHQLAESVRWRNCGIGELSGPDGDTPSLIAL